jgi:hypothetical protein
MSLDQTGCNWHMSGSKDGEARHSPLGQHASTKRRNAWWHTQKAGEHAPDGRTPATQTGSQKAPAVAHDRRHGRTQRATTAATAAPDSAPKTAPARQKRGATGHRSRAQRAAQTTPPTGKSSPRRSTRSMVAHAHKAPKAANSTNWRQTAYEAPEGPKSLENASDQSNTGGSWQQTAGGRGFAGAQNPEKSR